MLKAFLTECILDAVKSMGNVLLMGLNAMKAASDCQNKLW